MQLHQEEVKDLILYQKNINANINIESEKSTKLIHCVYGYSNAFFLRTELWSLGEVQSLREVSIKKTLSESKSATDENNFLQNNF